jgi:hypothetical protein
MNSWLAGGRYSTANWWNWKRMGNIYCREIRLPLNQVCRTEGMDVKFLMSNGLTGLRQGDFWQFQANDNAERLKEGST